MWTEKAVPRQPTSRVMDEGAGPLLAFEVQHRKPYCSVAYEGFHNIRFLDQSKRVGSFERIGLRTGSSSRVHIGS